MASGKHWTEIERPVVRMYGRKVEIDVRIVRWMAGKPARIRSVQAAVKKHISGRYDESYYRDNIAIYSRGDGTIVVIPGET